MDRQQQVQLPVEQFIQRMQVEFEQAMRQVAEAVNQAPDGQWINGSEVQVLEVMTEFRRKTFETALQMRIDEAEGTFSPGGRANPQEEAEQGVGPAFDAERGRAGVAAGVARDAPRRRRGGTPGPTPARRWARRAQAGCVRRPCAGCARGPGRGRRRRPR